MVPAIPSPSVVRFHPAAAGLLLLLLAPGCGSGNGGGGADAGAPFGVDGGAPDAAWVAAFDAWLAPQVAPLLDVNGAPGKATGVVVGVSAPGLRHAFGYGVSRVGGEAPHGDTVFEVGSLTKVYTGLLLGLAVEDGSAALDEPLDAFFPGGAPSRGGTSVSLLDLATHHSGLPNYDPGYSSGVPMNPGANYAEADLAACMAGGCPLDFVPGTRAQYSNLGSGTLGHVLGKRAGAAGYQALLSQRVLVPLQLQDTATVPSPAQQARLAQGYAGGSPAPKLQIGEPLAGAGALRSTAFDVLRFVESASGTGGPALAAAWQRVLTPYRGAGVPGTQMGLQVAVEPVGGATVYSKSGGTPGFSSHLLFTASPHAAVVVWANGKAVEIRPLALAALERLQAPR